MSQDYRVIKPAINFTRSDNKDQKRKGQMVRDESDFTARVQWLEQQISQMPNLQQQIRNQEQQIQVLTNDNDLFRKIQQRLLDDTIKLKAQTVSSKKQEGPNEDLLHIKQYLTKLQTAITDVVVKQQEQIKTLEDNLKQINQQLASFLKLKHHEIDDKPFRSARDPQIEKLSDQLEQLKIKHKTGMALSSRVDIDPFATNPRSLSSHSQPSNTSQKKKPESLLDINKIHRSIQNQQMRQKKRKIERVSVDRQVYEQKALKTEESLSQIQRSEQKSSLQRPSSSNYGNYSPSRKHNKTQSFDEMFNLIGNKLQIPEALERLKQRYINNETNIQETSSSINNNKKTPESAVNLWSLYGTKKSSLKATTMSQVSQR